MKPLVVLSMSKRTPEPLKLPGTVGPGVLTITRQVSVPVALVSSPERRKTRAPATPASL